MELFREYRGEFGEIGRGLLIGVFDQIKCPSAYEIVAGASFMEIPAAAIISTCGEKGEGMDTFRIAVFSAGAIIVFLLRGACSHVFAEMDVDFLRMIHKETLLHAGGERVGNERINQEFVLFIIPDGIVDLHEIILRNLAGIGISIRRI